MNEHMATTQKSMDDYQTPNGQEARHERIHTVCFHLYNAQKQTKLPCGFRSQGRACPWQGFVPEKHE